MTRNLRTVAVFKNERGYVQDLIMYKTFSQYGEDDYKMRHLKDLEEQGYVLQECVITNNEVVFYKSKLNAKLATLRSVQKEYNEYLDELKLACSKQDTYVTEDLISEVDKCQKDFIETLMKGVARAVRHCLNYEIEVTDDLAIDCYNFVKDNPIREAF